GHEQAGGCPPSGREKAQRIVVVVEGEADLLEVVRTLGACGGLTDLLDGRDEQADENGDDGDHHQQLDQRERAALLHRTVSGRGDGEGPGRPGAQRMYGRRGGSDGKRTYAAASPPGACADSGDGRARLLPSRRERPAR